MTSKKDWIVHGIGYTPEWNQDHRSNVFEPHEMTEELAKSTIGLPVFINHDDSVPIGIVHDAKINCKKELQVWLRIYYNNILLKHLIDMIRNRSFKGISAGTQVIIIESKTRNGVPYKTVSKITFKEFSIVDFPDRPNCIISDFYEHSK